MSTTATQPEYTGINDTVSNQPIKVGDTVVCYDNAANDVNWGLDKKHTGIIVRQGGAYVLKIGNDVLENWANAENIEILAPSQPMYTLQQVKQIAEDYNEWYDLLPSDYPADTGFDTWAKDEIHYRKPGELGWYITTRLERSLEEARQIKKHL